MLTHFHWDLARATCAGVVGVSLSLANSAALASGAPAICKTYLPIQAMTHVLGSKSAHGYFVRKDGACSVVLMIAETFDPDGAAMSSAARLRVVLQPGQSAGLDSEEGRSLKIDCGADAKVLHVTIGPSDELVPLQQASDRSLCLKDATNN